MATLDPAIIERELEALRRQRYEASQRVRASRLPAPGAAIQGRNPTGDSSLGPTRQQQPGSGRFGPERGFSGPPPLRTDGLRATGSFRDGPLSGRLGPGPSPRGPPGGALQDGTPRGRFEGGLGGRPSRDPGEYSRDRDTAGATAKPSAAAAPPPRRRAVLSMVVTDRPAVRDGNEDDNEDDKAHQREDVGGDTDRNADRDRDRDSGRPGYHEDRQRGWGRRGGGEEEDRHRGPHGYEQEHGYGSGGPRGVKRLASEVGPPGGGGGVAVAEDPDSRKRARRLLGRALLGTLQKFRQEDAQFQASDAAARRAELARKAEEKAAAEAERLRRQAAEDRSRKRQEELEALMDLNLATDIKMLELLYAKKLARRRALAAFLRADGVAAAAAAAAAGGKGAPAHGRPAQSLPVYWMPASHCEATLALKARQQQELREWEEAVLAELEQEKEGLRMRAEGRKQGMAERRQRAVEARAAGREGEGGAAAAEGREEEDEEEDHEAFEAVELDAHHEEEEVEERGGKEAPNGALAGAAGDAPASKSGEVEDAMESEAAAVAARDDSDSGAADDVVA